MGDRDVTDEFEQSDEVVLRDAKVGTLRFERVRQMYELALAKGEHEAAADIAILALPHFPSRSYFFSLVWNGPSSGGRKIAAARTSVELADSGKAVPAKVLCKAVRVLEEQAADDELLAAARVARNRAVEGSGDPDLLSQIAREEEKRRLEAAFDVVGRNILLLARNEGVAPADFLGPLRDAEVGALQFERIRQLYELALSEGEHEAAADIAILALPHFPSRSYFFSLVWDGPSSAGRKIAAARTSVELADSGKAVPANVLCKAVRVLEEQAADDEVLAAARVARNRAVEGSGDRELLLARIAQEESRHEAAWDHVDRHLRAAPNDAAALRLRGMLAYRSGRWGKHAEALRALTSLPEKGAAGDIVRCINRFLTAHGTSLEDVVRLPPDQRDLLSTPGSVFEYVARTAPAADGEPRSGVVMVAGSLAGGGAERVVATSYRILKQRYPREAISLWLFRKTFLDGRDGLFYLAQTGEEVEDIAEVAEPTRIDDPFSWLPSFLARKSQAICDRLMMAKPRVLHATLDHVNLAVALAGLVSGVPRIILHCHNMRPRRDSKIADGYFGWDRAYRALLSRKEVVLVNVSKAAIDDYMEWVGRDSVGGAKVIYNGFDFSEFSDPGAEEVLSLRQALSIPDRAPVVGTALRFTDVKRPSLWLDAAAKIHSKLPNAHFVMYGDGELLDACRTQAAAAGLGECVHFPGRISDLYRRLPLFDVLMLSSRTEGLPNVLIEAQAAGVVPVAFDVGGCGETMIPGETGVLVQEETSDALALAVLGVVADRSWRSEASKKGRRFVRRKFSLDRMIDELSALLDLQLDSRAVGATSGRLSEVARET